MVTSPSLKRTRRDAAAEGPLRVLALQFLADALGISACNHLMIQLKPNRSRRLLLRDDMDAEAIEGVAIVRAGQGE